MDFFIRLLALLSDHTKWTRGTWARDTSGEHCHIRSDRAACWCLEGAAIRCDVGEDEVNALQKAVELKGYKTIAGFNDDKDTTYEDVIQVIYEARNILLKLPMETRDIPEWDWVDTVLLLTIVVMVGGAIAGSIFVWSYLC